jgi:hypothetical protein
MEEEGEGGSTSSRSSIWTNIIKQINWIQGTDHVTNKGLRVLKQPHHLKRREEVEGGGRREEGGEGTN